MSGQRILVVEDHEPLLAAIQGILEGEGYDVFTAADGAQALQEMENIWPDLIVADIMMPRMDGYAFYKTVRSRPEWVPIPFIFLTAKAEKEDVLRGKDMGAEDYLTKPFDPQELLVAVRSKLRRARAIQQATDAKFDELKQQIVNVLGHELRTPLTYVRGYTELALEEVPTLTPESLHDFLLGIKRGTDRLNRLVEDLMFLIRLDTGQAAEEYHMLAGTYRHLTLVLDSVIRQYEEQAEAQGVALEAELLPDLPPVELCEPFFIDALGRLIDNGIKFSRGETKVVTVSSRVLDEAGTQWIEVAVTDQGVGVPKHNLHLLFERFRQIGREQMEQQGAGLGLAISQELIRLHGGKISVESTFGAGSTFTIRLPVVEGKQLPDNSSGTPEERSP
jgi:two-component system sensor histidine kinase/response regulator